MPMMEPSENTLEHVSNNETEAILNLAKKFMAFSRIVSTQSDGGAEHKKCYVAAIPHHHRNRYRNDQVAKELTH